MEKQKAVVPTVYEFRVPKETRVEKREEDRRVVSGVAITNKIQPKQGASKPVDLPVESSFLIQNVKKPAQPISPPSAPLSVTEDDQGFPYDDQADVLFGSPQHTARNPKPASKPLPAIVLPTSDDPLLAIRQQARSKVQSWVKSKAAQRAVQLQREADGYKRYRTHRPLPFLSPSLKYQLRCTSARNSVARSSVARLKQVCEEAKEGDRDDQQRSDEAHVKRVYSAVPRTNSHPAALLYDPEAHKRGIDSISPVVLDFVYELPSSSHPWIPSEVQGEQSSDSSFEDVPFYDEKS